MSDTTAKNVSAEPDYLNLPEVLQARRGMSALRLEVPDAVANDFNALVFAAFKAIDQSKRTEVTALREALKPFADAADAAEQFRRHGGYPEAPDDETASFKQRGGGEIRFEPTMGQLRRARAALNGDQP